MTTLSDPLVTLREVARWAKVSVKTASRVANAAPHVAPDTRRRVLRVIEALGYRPNSLARSIRTRRSHTLALIVPSIRNPFYPAIARGVEDAVAGTGYGVFVASADRDATKEARSIALLVEKRVDGIILGSPVIGPRALEPAHRAGIPVVAMNPNVPLPGAVALVIDNRRAAREMTGYLVSLGHQAVGYIDGIPTLGRCRERLRGYRDGLRAAGLPFDPEQIERGEFDYDAAYAAARKLLERRPTPTCLFAGNDLMALGAMAAAWDLGLRVPGDLSVAGFDDIDLATVVRPALTTVHQPNYEMGRLAVDLLLGRAEPPATPGETRVTAARLVVRQSTSPPGDVLRPHPNGDPPHSR